MQIQVRIRTIDHYSWIFLLNILHAEFGISGMRARLVVLASDKRLLYALFAYFRLSVTRCRR